MTATKDVLLSTPDRVTAYLYGTKPKALSAIIVPAKNAEIEKESIPDKYKNVPILRAFEELNEDRHTLKVMVTPGLDVAGLMPKRRLIYRLRERTTLIEKVVKRSVDILGSGMGLVFSAPLWLLAVPFIKSEGGPVFFAQARVGRGGKPFFCLKFRTMVPNAEEKLEALLEGDPQAKAEYETYKKLKNDPRCTRMGRFLRHTSLDEIPQLINVFKGDMSLVGPRPIIPSERKDATEEEYELYCSVRPGLTGFWQVNGRNQTSFRQRMHCDRFYVEQWSLWLDIKILFKTVWVFLSRKGAH